MNDPLWVFEKCLDLIHQLIFDNQHNCICLMMYFTFILGKWIPIHSTEKNYLHLHCNSYWEQRALTPFTKCMCLSSSPFVWTSLMSSSSVLNFGSFPIEHVTYLKLRRLSKWKKWHLFHSKWSKLLFWVKIVVIFVSCSACNHN